MSKTKKLGVLVFIALEIVLAKVAWDWYNERYKRSTKTIVALRLEPVSTGKRDIEMVEVNKEFSASKLTQFHSKPDKSLVQVDDLFEMKLFQDPAQNEMYKEYIKSSIKNYNWTQFIAHKIFRPRSQKSGISNQPFITILEYTKAYGNYRFCDLSVTKNNFLLNSAEGQEFLTSQNMHARNGSVYNLLDKCEFKNCFFTCDKQMVSKVNAVLFHHPSLSSSIGEKKEEYISGLKSTRRNEQFWILSYDEAGGADPVMNELNFNYTFNFNSRSEVSYCAYGCYRKRKTPWLSQDFDYYLKTEFKKREKVAVWFVSNCRSLARMKFATELSYWFQIKMYGNCVAKIKALTSFDFSKVRVQKKACKRDSNCETQVLSENKFYLSFENQNCSDYITEKFWRSLKSGIVPIVLQPKKMFYEKIAPPGSFIHAEDFGYSVARLSAYLSQVSANRTLFSSFLEWKKSFELVEDGTRLRICELCAKLNKNLRSRFESYYGDVHAWFTSQCTRA